MEELFVLSIGVVNPNTGKTMYEWGIYDDFWKNGMSASLTTGGHLLFSAGKGFDAGEEFALRSNDSRRFLKLVDVIDSCQVSKESLLDMLKRNGYDYTPLRPFAKRAPGNKKLSTSYVLK